jgi:outer membrane protein TolC
MHPRFSSAAWLLILLVAAFGAVAEEPMTHDPATDPLAGVERLDRATLVAAVLARNPDLASAEAAWQAAGERPAQMASLPDPKLSYGFGPLSIHNDDVVFGQVLEISQGLPYPGKLRLRGEAAEARSEMAGDRYQQMRLDLARRTADLFYDLYLVDRSIAINQEHVRLLEELKQIATARYASGLVPQQVPLAAEVELTHLIHRDVTLRAERGSVVAHVNHLLHRGPTRPLPPVAPLGVADLPVEAAAGALVAEGPVAGRGEEAPEVEARSEQLTAAALVARPEVAAADAEIRAREMERQLATLERRPDFGVMTSYSSMWRNIGHQWMVGVSLNLPVRKKRILAGEAEAAAALDSARLRRRAVADQIRAEVVEAADRLAEMAQVVDLYESRLLPAAHDQLRAARSGFETGQVSFLSVVEAEKNLRSVELGYEEARTDRHRRRADLERALGVPPDELATALAPAADSEPNPEPEPQSEPRSETNTARAADAAGGAR